MFGKKNKEQDDSTTTGGSYSCPGCGNPVCTCFSDRPSKKELDERIERHRQDQEDKKNK